VNCEEARGLIAADCWDHEADPETAGSAAEHVLECEACRAYAANLRAGASGLLKNAPALDPPAELWSKIKDRITERELERARAGLAGRLRDLGAAWLSLRRIALTVPVLAAVFIAVLVLPGRLARIEPGASLPAAAGAGVMDGAYAVEAAEENVNFGSLIEDFFI
jgi:hypothetical protein